jgi:hypothetical protein
MSDHAELPEVHRPRRWALVLGGTLLGIQGSFLVVFAALVVRARLHKGEWPHPRSGNPFDDSYRPATMDPKDLGVHSSLVWGLLAAVVYTGPLVVPAVLGLLIPRSRRRSGMALGLVIASGICVVLLVADPSGFMLWLED